MKLSELIKTYRHEHNLSLRAFAERTICSFQYISNIEKEEVKNPSIPTLVSIAKAMNMTLDQLLKITDDFMIDIQLDGKGRILKNGWQTGKRVSDVTGEVIDDDSIFEILANPNIFKVPLYDSISCGTGGFVGDNIIDYVSLPSNLFSPKKEYFAQYAHGDSMINANINDGDLVIFEKTSSVTNGMIGCFCVDDNIATCKRLSMSDGQIILLPENPSYNPIIANVETFKCIGKLAFVINDRRAEEDK
jgi:SOS-response transcriptional repressor